MKKLLIALLAAVLTSGAFAQDTAFPDIPANHWAADAVARITDLGIIIGFPDGTFRGNEAFTRYQTALVISRTLDVITNNIEAMGVMSAEDIAVLNAALEQLASDQAAQGVRLAATESDVASLGDDVIADGARIDDLEAAINGVMMNMVDPMVVQEMQDQIASLGVAAANAASASAAADSGLQNQINALEVAIDAADAAASAAASAAAAAASQSAAADAELRRAVAALSAAADAAAAASAAGDSGLQDQIDALGAAAAAAAAAAEAADAALSDAIDAAAAAAAAALDDAAAASAAGDAELRRAIAALSAASDDADAGLQDQIDALGAAATAAAAASDAGDAALSDAIAALGAAADDAAAASAAADAGLQGQIDVLRVSVEAASARADAASARADAVAADAAAARAALQGQIDALGAAATAAAAASESADAALSDALDALSAAAAAAAAESAAADAALSDALDAAAAASESADAALSDALAAAAAASATADAAIRDEVAAAAAELQDQVHALSHDVEDAAAASEAADAALSDALAAAAAASEAADASLGDSIAAAAAAAEVARAKLSDALAAAAAESAAAAANNAAGVADNAGDIANIREFVILLRRNQVAIRDRVAALEGAHAEAIEGLDNRVGALEANLFDLSGSIKVSYKMVHVGGPNSHFDLDRAFGNGFGAPGLSTISTRAFDDDDPKDGKIDRQPHEDADIRGDEEKGVDVTLTVNLGFGDSLEGYAKLSLAKIPVLEKVAEGKEGEGAVAGDYNINTGEYYAIKVDRLYTAAKVGGMTDLEVTFGEKAGLSHGAYGSSFTDSDGINFRLVPGMVALNPEISGFFVPKALDKDKNIEAAAAQGLELRLSPMQGVSVGAHLSRWASEDTDGSGGADTQDTVNALVIGFDAALSLQLFDVTAEWERATRSDDASMADDAFYVTLKVDDMMGGMMMPIPLLDSLSASYFDVADDWAALARANSESFPFKEDQAGLVANVGLDLVLVDLDAYVTSYRLHSTQDSALALGADATAALFSGLSLEGFFHTVSVTPAGGTAVTVDDVKTHMNANEVAVASDSLERDKNYDTGFGITLKHDGMSADALVSGLDLNLGYKQTEADFSKRTISAGAKATLPIDIITVAPYGSIEWVTDTDANPDNTTTIKVGAGVTTQPIDTFLAPSLEGNVNYRNTAHANATAATYSANELQFAVGLSLNEFLFDESVLKARYGFHRGTNVQPNMRTEADDDPANATYAVSKDKDMGGQSNATNGFEIIWDYHGLELVYGSFTTDPNTAVTGDHSIANYVTISYSVNF